MPLRGPAIERTDSLACATTLDLPLMLHVAGHHRARSAAGSTSPCGSAPTGHRRCLLPQGLASLHGIPRDARRHGHHGPIYPQPRGRDRDGLYLMDELRALKAWPRRLPPPSARLAAASGRGSAPWRRAQRRPKRPAAHSRLAHLPVRPLRHSAAHGPTPAPRRRATQGHPRRRLHPRHRLSFGLAPPQCPLSGAGGVSQAPSKRALRRPPPPRAPRRAA